MVLVVVAQLGDLDGVGWSEVMRFWERWDAGNGAGLHPSVGSVARCSSSVGSTLCLLSVCCGPTRLGAFKPEKKQRGKEGKKENNTNNNSTQPRSTQL